MELKELLYQNFAINYPSIFNKHWKRKSIYRLSTKASRKPKTSNLPVDMFLYASKHINIIDEKHEICEMLVSEGCEEYINYLCENFEGISNALQTVIISESGYNVVRNLIKNVFWDRNSIDEIIKLFNIILLKLGKDGMGLICEWLDDLYYEIAYWGRAINSVNFHKLVSYQKTNKIPVPYYFSEAVVQFTNKQKLLDVIITIVPHDPIMMPNEITTNAEQFREYANRMGNTRYLCNYFSFSTLEHSIELHKLGYFEEVQRDYLEEIIAANINILTLRSSQNRNKIFELCLRDPMLLSVISDRHNYYVNVIAFLTAYAVINTEKDFLLNILDIYCEYYQKQNGAKTFAENLYEAFGDIRSYEMNEPLYYQYKDLILILDNTVREFNLSIARECSRFIDDVCSISEDLYIIIPKQENIIEEVKNGKLWLDDSHIPHNITIRFKYPNGKQGDIFMYLTQQYGNVRNISTMEYEANINSKFKDEISLLFNYISEDTKIPDEILNSFLLHILMYQTYNSRFIHDFEIYKEINTKIYDIYNNIKNMANTLYVKIIEEGKSTPKWKSEFQLYTVVSQLFPSAIYQYHASWLGSQSLDIFIPEISIGIEYQGEQHYRPIDYFGGQKSYEYTQERDYKKRKLCKDNGVTLIEWKYTYSITKENFKQILRKNIEDRHLSIKL